MSSSISSVKQSGQKEEKFKQVKYFPCSSITHRQTVGESWTCTQRDTGMSNIQRSQTKAAEVPIMSSDVQ